MASFRASLRAFLLADTGLTALIGNRIYSSIAPEDVTDPYLVINDVSNFARFDMNSEDGQDEERIQIDIYSQKYITCININSIIRSLLNRKHQYDIGNYYIYSSNLENIVEFNEKDSDGTENIWERISVDYMFVRDIAES